MVLRCGALEPGPALHGVRRILAEEIDAVIILCLGVALVGGEAWDFDRVGIATVAADAIALVVPHQANIRIISAACERLGIGLERTSVVLDHTGNTSSASVPLALGDALDRGRVEDGDLVLCVGFGAGMTAASAIIRWSTTVMEHQP